MYFWLSLDIGSYFQTYSFDSLTTLLFTHTHPQCSLQWHVTYEKLCLKEIHLKFLSGCVSQTDTSGKAWRPPHQVTVRTSSATDFCRAAGECCFHVRLRTQAALWFDPDTTRRTCRLRFEPNGMYLHRWRKGYSIQCPWWLSRDWTHPIAQCRNQILIWNINQYISPHWFLLAVFCLPVFISLAIFCVNCPHTQKVFCFLFHVATPAWLKSSCQTNWQDDSLGNGWKRHTQREREKREIPLSSLILAPFPALHNQSELFTPWTLIGIANADAQWLTIRIKNANRV